jgi:hypothetical protein
MKSYNLQPHAYRCHIIDREKGRKKADLVTLEADLGDGGISANEGHDKIERC